MGKDTEDQDFGDDEVCKKGLDDKPMTFTGGSGQDADVTDLSVPDMESEPKPFKNLK